MTLRGRSGEDRTTLAARMRREAVTSVRYGSPLYAALIEKSADDVAAGGPVWDVLDGLHTEIRRTYITLHLLGALNRLVLEGRAPELAAHFPSAGGDGDPDAAWVAMRALVAEQSDEIRRLASRPVQTNEPGRTAGLLGGFLLIARRTGLPLRLLEVGASAGLNLRWDRFRYESRAGAWGDPGSRVRFIDPFEDRVPPFDVSPRVVERAGCDADPVDPTTEEGRLTLMSYVWADQPARFALLEGAIDTARAVPVVVDRADANEWLPRMLEGQTPGVATVVFHSMFLHYLSRQERARLTESIAAAGARATGDAPLAHLSFESRDPDEVPPAVEVRLQTWPDGTDEMIAVAHPHGPPVRWLAG